MRQLLVLGGGTAGTMVVNRLRHRLGRDWNITVVDNKDRHDYQPGWLFLPFGTYDEDQVSKPLAAQIHKDVDLVKGDVARIDTAHDKVLLTDGTTLPYDQLIVATGTTPRPDETPGMVDDEWHRSVFDFYTLEGAKALRGALSAFTGGRLVVHIAEMPIKCPVAPLEFAFLADAHFRERGIRDQVEITYVTPLDGAFTKPIAANLLDDMLAERQIGLEPDFVIERVDNEAKAIVSYDERTIPFDLLVTVPVNMGADFVASSGLGDELNYVKVDPHTFLASGQNNIFALGDAANLPTSKAGSVAHFAVDVFVDNFVEHVAGRPMTESFDGHANCFVEAGNGKALLLDFNYDTQPLPGKYPVPVVGPMSLLEATHVNHLGKMAFKSIYWNVLLPGHALPVPTHMSMAGKVDPTPAHHEVTP